MGGKGAQKPDAGGAAMALFQKKRAAAFSKRKRARKALRPQTSTPLPRASNRDREPSLSSTAARVHPLLKRIGLSSETGCLSTLELSTTYSHVLASLVPADWSCIEDAVGRHAEARDHKALASLLKVLVSVCNSSGTGTDHRGIANAVPPLLQVRQLPVRGPVLYLTPAVCFAQILAASLSPTTKRDAAPATSLALDSMALVRKVVRAHRTATLVGSCWLTVCMVRAHARADSMQARGYPRRRSR